MDQIFLLYLHVILFYFSSIIETRRKKECGTKMTIDSKMGSMDSKITLK